MLLQRGFSDSPTAWSVCHSPRGEKQGLWKQILQKLHVGQPEIQCHQDPWTIPCREGSAAGVWLWQKKKLCPWAQRSLIVGFCCVSKHLEIILLLFNFAKPITVPESGRRLTSCPSPTSGIHEELPEPGPVQVFESVQTRGTEVSFELPAISFKDDRIKQADSQRQGFSFNLRYCGMAQHTKVSSSGILILAKFSFLVKQIFFLKYMAHSDFPLKKEIWELGVRLAQCLHQWQGSCHTLQVALD